MCYEIDTVDIWWTLRKILWAFQYIICKEDRPRHTAAVRPQAGRNPCFNGHHSVTAFSHWAIHLASIEIIQLPHSVTGPFTLLQLTSFSYRIQSLGHSPCFNWHHSVTAFRHWAIHLASIDIIQLPHSVTGLFTRMFYAILEHSKQHKQQTLKNTPL